MAGQQQNGARTLYWHDYETWGENPAQDRPSQFAGIRTDEQLNIIGEPLMLYCRPAPDTLPKPEACLVTGLTPQLALEQGVPEREFIAAILAELGQPGTCGVGYNSIRFDDEVTRYTLYRNFYDPYEREWRNGNSRWDIIDMLRMTRALRPEGIQWPNYDDGRPCFKLEELTRANNLSHESAHDALSDVYATIAIARLVREKQPKLYQYAYRLRDKRFAGSLVDIDSHKPLLHISSKFPNENGNAALVLPLMRHPDNNNSVLVFNLASNPADLLNLDVEGLRERLFVKTEDLPEGSERLALKEVHLNKTPMLLPPNMLDDKTARRLRINREQCEAHWRQLANLTLDERRALQVKLHQLYRERSFTPKTDPEQMLYDGFFDDSDKRLMAQVRKMSGDELAQQHFDFKDSRLPELLFRYRARHYPESLSSQEQASWRTFCRSRLTDPQAGGSLTWDQLVQRLATLRSGTLSDQQRGILTELERYGREQLQRLGLSVSSPIAGELAPENSTAAPSSS
ncbi:exodeoxyribonuclease I [Marinimicrobium sp. ABcell2]|uniref:exodeoxyribonuclease I n=1 Tax=Marinimicrobium sp. ABcell2 TaxID=3069751 RepID=UPI0027AE183A|nr:exodeoxyribonuclease I [Marinimicrobium sp. ABcell2]MDQ2078450.1 exodeoxyribonuclease I [Marinimicrobium sp. ABcell2]